MYSRVKVKLVVFKQEMDNLPDKLSVCYSMSLLYISDELQQVLKVCPDEESEIIRLHRHTMEIICPDR